MPQRKTQEQVAADEQKERAELAAKGRKALQKDSDTREEVKPRGREGHNVDGEIGRTTTRHNTPYER